MPGHDHEPLARSRSRLLVALALGSVVLVAEVVGGLLANSLALLADAGHYLVDLASLALAAFAVSWGLRPPTKRKTFGHRRGEVVAAFVQAIGLWAVVAVLIVEAVRRLQDPPTVEGTLVLWVAGGTLVTDLALAAWLRLGAASNLTVRAASLHLIGDGLGSAAALVSGALIRYRGWHIADPIVTLLISAVLLAFAWRLTRQSLHILLEGTPVHIDADAIAARLLAVPGVREVHDLHVWTHTPGVESLTAHVQLDRPHDEALARSLRDLLQKEFHIEHITLQVEGPDSVCSTVRHSWRPREGQA